MEKWDFVTGTLANLSFQNPFRTQLHRCTRKRISEHLNKVAAACFAQLFTLPTFNMNEKRHQSDAHIQLIFRTSRGAPKKGQSCGAFPARKMKVCGPTPLSPGQSPPPPLSHPFRPGERLHSPSTLYHDSRERPFSTELFSGGPLITTII